MSMPKTEEEFEIRNAAHTVKRAMEILEDPSMRKKVLKYLEDEREDVDTAIRSLRSRIKLSK